MSNKTNVHTVPNPSGAGWINKVGGTKRGPIYRTQKTASVAGRTIARRNESEHAIHRRNGTIGIKNSYGVDLFPPRG